MQCNAVQFAGNLPIDVTVVLPARRKLLAELDAGKNTRLATHAADELDDARHGPGHIDEIADLELAAVGSHVVGGCGGLPHECIQTRFPGNGCRLRK